MICDDVINLISENPEAHGVFASTTETKKQCYCRVESVSRSEFYRARENGIEPELVFVLSEYADYNGEKIVEHNGKRYRVIRAYVAGSNSSYRRSYNEVGNHSIELTVGEITADQVRTTSTTGSSQTEVVTNGNG